MTGSVRVHTLERKRIGTQICIQREEGKEEYPIHFEEDTGSPLGVTERGVGQAGAEAQIAPLELTNLPLLAHLALLLKVAPRRARHIPLLLRVIVI